MVRKLQKKSKGIEALEEMENVTDSEIKKLNDIRKQEFKDELDAGFFFSVVFDTRAERDAWLKRYNLKLIEDMFIKAKDFKV